MPGAARHEPMPAENVALELAGRSRSEYPRRRGLLDDEVSLAEEPIAAQRHDEPAQRRLVCSGNQSSIVAHVNGIDLPGRCGHARTVVVDPKYLALIPVAVTAAAAMTARHTDVEQAQSVCGEELIELAPARRPDVWAQGSVDAADDVDLDLDQGEIGSALRVETAKNLELRALHIEFRNVHALNALLVEDF